MKKVFVVLMCLALSGCVRTLVTKEVKVKKDADGKIIETIETERTTQYGETKGVQFDYLKNKQHDRSPATIYY
jgi:uncharacterized protein YceK